MSQNGPCRTPHGPYLVDDSTLPISATHRLQSPNSPVSLLPTLRLRCHYALLVLSLRFFCHVSSAAVRSLTHASSYPAAACNTLLAPS